MAVTIRDRQRGVALILVLWVCAVIALLSSAFIVTVGLEARRTANQVRIAAARALIDAGIAHAVMGIVDSEPGRRFTADGRAYQVTEGDARLTLRLWDETGRLDLNRAPLETLSTVLSAGAGPVGTRAVAFLLERRNAGQPLASVVELAAVEGSDATSFARLASLVTVHNAIESGDVAATTMPQALLRLWPGVTPTDVRALLEARERGSPVRGDLALRLPPLGLLTEAPPGHVYTVRVGVETSAGARASAEAVLSIAVDGGPPYRILEWREPALGPAFPDTDPPQ